MANLFENSSFFSLDVNLSGPFFPLSGVKYQARKSRRQRLASLPLLRVTTATTAALLLGCLVKKPVDTDDRIVWTGDAVKVVLQ